jgi:hypothetical protein
VIGPSTAGEMIPARSMAAGTLSVAPGAVLQEPESVARMA